MARPTLTEADLAHFHGTDTWYQHRLVRSVTYTEGAQYVAEHGGAYWLLDEIAFAQVTRPVIAGEPFQVWGLREGTCDETSLGGCVDSLFCRS
jgi:hypothetical protein